MDHHAVVEWFFAFAFIMLGWALLAFSNERE